MFIIPDWAFCKHIFVQFGSLICVVFFQIPALDADRSWPTSVKWCLKSFSQFLQNTKTHTWTNDERTQNTNTRFSFHSFTGISLHPSTLVNTAVATKDRPREKLSLTAHRRGSRIQGHGFWPEERPWNVTISVVTPAPRYSKNTRGSRLIRICQIRNWGFSELFPKSHSYLSCV